MSVCGVFLLPEDMQVEILIRLPVKSIGKSRCVSKQWHSLLTNPRFITAHLARSKKNVLIHNYESLFSFTCTLCPDGGEAEGNFRKLDAIPLLESCCNRSAETWAKANYRKERVYTIASGPMVVGPCNGLILVVIKGYKFLMNPTTLEHFRLPESADFVRGRIGYGFGYRISYGFGYDSSTHDYKVVALSWYNIDYELSNIFADIYSMKWNCWRKSSDNYGPFVHGFDKPGVFVNGALHWMACKKIINSGFLEDVICALDLGGTEKFHEIPCLSSLESLRGENKLCDNLIDSKGCLGIAIVDENHATIDIWTMKKYGMAESWTKTVVFDVVGCGSWYAWPCLPWCLRDALILRHPGDQGSPDIGRWTCYSFNEGKSFNLTVDKRTNPDLFEYQKRLDVLVFSESLVSPRSSLQHSTTKGSGKCSCENKS